MGAHQIKRFKLKVQANTLRNIKKRAKIKAANIYVTIIQDEATKEVKCVAIDRDAAIRYRSEKCNDNGELIDFVLEI